MKTDSLIDTLLTPGALSVVLQPILEIKDGYRLHALECLTRGPRGTNLERADVLFDYVRRKREEVSVDRACIKSALQAASLLPGNHKISINVHASTLARDTHVVEFLKEAAAAYGLELNRLIIEIVEHSGWWDTRALQETLAALRNIGIAIALDDVGLGQSNLKMILDCRPDYLKIDRYFVHECDNDFHRLVLLESLTRVAHQFGAKVVAEGVERAADLDRLLSFGINLVQGYLFAKANSPSDILKSGVLTRETVPHWSAFAVEANHGSH